MNYTYCERLMWVAIAPAAFRYLARQELGWDISALKQLSKQIYRQMVSRTPDIGSMMENPLRVCLTGGILWLSIYKAAEEKMSEKCFEGMVSASMRSPLVVTAFRGKAKTAFTLKAQYKRAATASLADADRNPFQWNAEVIFGRDAEEYTILYHQCGLCALGRQEGLPHLVPYLCALDTMSVDWMGGRLYRNPILNDVSLSIPQGSMTAIVGPSGSGKTTITRLIARFWDVQDGSITVGGHDVKEFTCDSLLKNMSMVFQNVYLFRDTIENNIKFGFPEATHEQVVEAAKKACCHDFISALPQGYDTVIGEGGSTLSGGEKQRISIARAMLKDAPIILLDEATASVDPENEVHLQQAISALVKNKTLIVIAHRLSTIRDADQILVVDNGKIVEKGVHVELIQQKGIYQKFWNIRQKARNWKLAQ